ncbi:S1C family serine protease [Bittarella massiliensis (ex Durand et al. 2017)]|uniref:Trypsin-like serine protease n=1 Tax=Bittarella massiliensis (ex Durand et al. 2017) TaxID=1720313 RepID=A0ABW9WXV7_9FIRM|nr:trypsin-like peptidase domain-containing protein [Bittarella massiliensis (ex Durand et al. 2017)]MZL70368.1 trypsin-like serine protease [Bittarella massiliensis (ex Durand et al. 2017)]MZL81651.1 trypsin-like serine protease [Bittarella massiliensis (ex Durand et al. 2017)]
MFDNQQNPETPRDETGGASPAGGPGGSSIPGPGPYGQQQPGGYRPQTPPPGGGAQGDGQFPYSPYRPAVPGGAQPFVFDPDRYASPGGLGGKRPDKKPKKGRGAVAFAVILCCVLALSGILVGANILYKNSQKGSGGQGGSSQAGVTIQNRPEDGDDGAETKSGEKMTTEQVATKVKPAVVGIAVYSQQSTVEASSYGSGIIMSADGYIITNAHVVEGAVGLTITLENDEEYTGKVVGTDTKTDLAVVKIEAQNLTYAEFGNSDQMKVGEDVLAIGNPGGPSLAGSVTKGIVSAVNRTVGSSTGYSLHCIQTDAAINPGNSGGALVNMYGQVVGINSSKIAKTEYEGIGFAIAINEAKPIIDGLIQNGYVKDRVKLGVTVIEINDTTSRLNGLPKGLYIKSIDQGSSLEGTGVQPGDIIRKFNGESTESYEALQAQLKNCKPGDEVKLTIYRSQQSGTDKTFEVVVTLKEDVPAPATTNQSTRSKAS